MVDVLASFSSHLTDGTTLRLGPLSHHRICSRQVRLPPLVYVLIIIFISVSVKGLGLKFGITKVSTEYFLNSPRR